MLVAALAIASPAFPQADPGVALLERAGWEAVAAGQADVAAGAFRRAITADPGNARLQLGAATAAFMQRRDADAKRALDRALTLDPKLAGAESLMGQVLRRMGDLPAAIRVFEKLALEKPNDTGAQATLDRWRRELDLQQKMQQTVGDHFAVSFEGPPDDPLAAKVMQSLDRAYWRIGAVLNTLPNVTVPVVLYTTQQFTDLTRSPSWAAGAYDGMIRVPMRGAPENDAEMDRVLAHEFTHALVHTLSPTAIPTWLNEGLATALESDDLEWAEQIVGKSGGVPLEILRSSFGRLTGAQAALAYASSAVTVHRMLQEAGGPAVANLIRDLGAGAEFESAFARRIQRPFDEFQASLRPR
jgi:tetratricopeptide (TPR) repeat protein